MNQFATGHVDPNNPSNAFAKARKRLHLSQRELAEKLNTSLYALTRWEKGDALPSKDALRRLDLLLSDNSTTSEMLMETDIVFESSGIRSKISELPLFKTKDTAFLPSPRSSVLDDIYRDHLWGDSDLALSDIFSRHSNPAVTRNTPLDEEISAGKNTYTYDAHTYHTKVPPQGIASIISRYLPEGGVVLDPFAGSGMTGVAARYLGYDVILNELSPAASFIAHNFTNTINTDEFNAAVSAVTDRLENLRKNIYTTECRECGKNVEQLYTVWSYKLECNHCQNTFVLWEHCRKYGNNIKEHKLLKKFPCPNCGEEVNKSYLPRHEPVPVFLGYKCCGKKIVEHPLNQKDLEIIKDAEEMVGDFLEDSPCNALPDGVNLKQPKRHGLDSIDKFYTSRNLIACSAIWKEIRKIENPEIAAAVGFVFTSLYRRVTRLSEYRFWGGSGNTANFNVPHISNESNVFVTFERKAKSISDHFLTTAEKYKGRSAIRTGSATDLSFLPNESIDLIFTDPPFGGNINYSEMNILWESWLKSFTSTKDEAIVNKSQGKDLGEYGDLMLKSLREAYRVLRKNHWMVLVFMNSSEKVWSSLHDAIKSSGFCIEKINIFDKQHGTFKQFVSENTAGSDLIIHCRKNENFDPESINKIKSFESVSEFISKQNQEIPISPFLHVKRDDEIDYRTLYSRYISSAIQNNNSVIDFSRFRAEAFKLIRDKK